MPNLHKAIESVTNIWSNEPVFCFTADVDWASEDAIEYCYKIFEDYDIPVTYFLTHKSNFLLNKINEEKITAGIHPNFMTGSSHGDSIDEVIDYCMKLIPNPKCFRSHRYYDVNDITEIFYNLGFKYDSNICTFLQKVNPFIHRSGLIRFPIYFEDGAYLFHNQSLNFDEVKTDLFYQDGLMIINIHPMHMVLNSPNFMYAREIKDNLSREELNLLTRKELKKLSYHGSGIRDFIIRLLDFIKINHIQIYTLNEIYEKILEADDEIYI